MHGRLKVKTTAEKEAERNAEREKKKILYQKGMCKIKAMFNSGDRSTDLLTLMMKILENIPELGTLWNWRRVILLDLFSKTTAAAKEGTSPNNQDGEPQENSNSTKDSSPNKLDLICSEKLFVARCLEMNPKAYSLWLHRRWLVEQNSTEEVIKKELGLCNLFLKYDERNFHCWDYRRFIVRLGRITPASELEVSTSLIERNFSNYSAWHYRSTLLDVSDEAVVRGELEWTQNAYFTDPNDQSVWLYYQWLLGRDRQCDTLLSGLLDLHNNKVHVLFNNLLYNTPTHLQIFDDTGSAVSPVTWTSTNSPARLWSADLPTDVSTDGGVTVKCEEVTVKINPICFIGTSTPNVCPGTPLTAPQDIVTEQLENIRELYELEPDNKWVILTLLNMIHATQPHKTKDQISEIRNLAVKLCQVDPMRTGYYRDLWSKVLCETAVTAWWSGVSRDLETVATSSDYEMTSSTCDKDIEMESTREPLNLPKMYLTKLAHPDFMFTLRELDISHNNLTDLTGFSSLINIRKLNISYNKLSSLEGIDDCKHLENLDASNNVINNPCTVLPCTKCRLHTLYLAGNPLTGSEAYPGCVLESCPMLCQLDGKEL